MSLGAHYKEVFYAEVFPHGGTVGVSVGLGMTPGGKLGCFVYDPAADAVCEVVWPRQIAADTPHIVGITTDGSSFFLYVDGDRYVMDAANVGWESVGGTLTFTTAAGDHAALGGAWLGYMSPLNGLNAHWADLGRFAFWDRALSRAEMSYLHSAGGNWPMYELQRMGCALDFAGWPAAWRDGLTMPHTTYQLLADPQWDIGTSAFDLIGRAAASVGGVVFCAADGKLTYQRPTDRDVTATPGLIFTDGDGTSIDDTFAYQVDDNDIVNVVTATTKSGVSLEVADQPSIDLYGERATSLDTDLYYAVDVATTAARLVNRYKQPILRCPVVTVDVTVLPDDSKRNGVLALELGDTIGLDDLPATAPAVAMSVTVESISWDIDAASDDWKVTFEVSPGQMYTHGLLGSLVLDSATLGG